MKTENSQVQHCMLVHWGDGSVKWEKIAEESAVEARALSAAHAITSNIWRCAHCRDSVSDRDGHKSGGISVHLATLVQLAILELDTNSNDG